jgi:small nuclear ribonucleoprotein D3
MATVPVKLLHEGEGHPVTVELKNGELYRGQLVAAEDNMNCQLSGVTCFAKDGQASKLEHVYLRGSQIRFVVLPDILKNAPMFKKVVQVKEAREKALKSKPKGAAGRALSFLNGFVLPPVRCPISCLGLCFRFVNPVLVVSSCLGCLQKSKLLLCTLFSVFSPSVLAFVSV